MTLQQKLKQLLRKPKAYNVTLPYIDKDGLAKAYVNQYDPIVWHMVKDSYIGLGASYYPVY
jgi:UTP:GlnB (protein PII) uridylyltransferase